MYFYGLTKRFLSLNLGEIGKLSHECCFEDEVRSRLFQTGILKLLSLDVLEIWYFDGAVIIHSSGALKESRFSAGCKCNVRFYSVKQMNS